MKKVILITAILLIAVRAYAVMEIIVEAEEQEPGIYDYIFGAGYIEKSRVLSAAELLQSITSIEVINRGVPGAQADLRFNGGSFEQAAIMLDGMRVNDPQTGHYNTDLPVTIYDTGEISVLKNGNSIAGAGGFSGVVDIKTKRHKKDSFKFFSGYGSFNTSRSALSLVKVYSGIEFSLSGEKLVSDGYHYATDLDKATLFFKTAFTDNYFITAGYDEKEYGAYDFYTPGLGYPSREYLVTRYLNFRAGPLENLYIQGFYKNHYDRFTLDGDNPSFYQNEHETKIFGAAAVYSVNFDRANNIRFRYDFRREEIESTNLGNHFRASSALSASGFFLPSENLSVNANCGVEIYDVYNGAGILPSLAAEYVINGSVKASAAYSYSIRYPSYTDLYYSGPLNEGNPDLNPEKSHEASAGAKVQAGKAEISAGIFYKNSSDLIDWAENTGGVKTWKTENIASVETKGATLDLKLPLDFMVIEASYTFSDSFVSETYISKYEQYMRNKAVLCADFEMFSFRIKAKYLFKNYASRSDCYSGMDILLSREVFKGAELTFRCNDIFDSKFEEVPEIPAPGRIVEVIARGTF